MRLGGLCSRSHPNAVTVEYKADKVHSLHFASSFPATLFPLSTFPLPNAPGARALHLEIESAEQNSNFEGKTILCYSLTLQASYFWRIVQRWLRIAINNHA